MAITSAEIVSGGGGNPAPAQTFTGAVSVGDVLVAQVLLIGNPVSVTVTDNVNAGNYSSVASFYDSTNGWWYSIHAKQSANSASAGSLIVSATQGSNQFGNIDIQRLSGFTGIMTVDAALALNFSGSTAAISCSPLTSGYANEVFFAGMHSTVGISSGPSGAWTTNANGRSYYAIEGSSGTTDNFAITLNSAVAWSALIGAIYDAPATVPLTRLSRQFPRAMHRSSRGR